ncbi:hypothetical protein LTR36_004295 [Oleoguttula mirabilis]|uniref:HTH APSES-type domain-containing protein n=1 Tax=Oleoguttula mirabilis TaxID=1507867 RepID=A0AAV9JHR7_9PEZI|nr:hypothetical protein LTR36_004295 [Oleoguttula mirabilis]
MAAERTLPEDRNPMLEEERAPLHDILIERRCLGQTELKVKAGQVGLNNATKPDNLGMLDYAHLRVPLPKDLGNSGIFSKGTNRKFPEAYFLMRRSNDGYISATGMFKAAFPYAQVEEEVAEKDYIKSLPTTSSEEVAGNVWIHPDQALELADEYGIRLWIAALLDPEPIAHGTGSEGHKSIRSPPSFHIKDMVNGLGRSPEKKTLTDGRHSTRGRRSASVRSESPAAQSRTPGRPKATPRKPRKGRGTLSRVDEAASFGSDSVNGDAKLQPVQETVKIEVQTTTRESDSGDEEVESTKVNVEMPIGHPELPIPNDTEEMLKVARQMVAEAQQIGGPAMSKGKRKAVEMIDDDDELEEPVPAKKARKIEIALRKEKIKMRAMTGIAASLAVGYVEHLAPTV